MCEQNASYFGEALRIGGKNLDKIYFKNCLKSSKMANKICQFSKFSGETYPKNPTAVFGQQLTSNQLCRKNCSYNNQVVVPPP